MKEFIQKLTLPKAMDKKWGFVFLGVFITILLTLIINTLITTNSFSLDNLIGYLLLSLAVASLSSLGYFRLKWFSKIMIGTSMFASLYLIVASILLINNSWGDLISIGTFTMIIVVGVIMGITVQVGDFIYKIVKK
jgi:hypothetical protein